MNLPCSLLFIIRSENMISTYLKLKVNVIILKKYIAYLGPKVSNCNLQSKLKASEVII